MHEQDLRRTLHTPGNLASPGALVTRDVLVSRLPKVVAKLAGAPAGTTVAFDITGPLEFLRTVRVDETGRASVDGQIILGPDVQFTLDWETYLRLATGRVRPEAVAGSVKADGDTELAERILANFR